MGKRINIVAGQKFGRWNVIGFDRKETKRDMGRQYWLCRCDCGVERSIMGSYLKSGRSKSCGCINKEYNHNKCVTHGMSLSPEYKAWQNAIDRCTNPNNQSFFRYGMRGISVCDRWLNSFEMFFEDMGKKPSPKHELDRIVNDGNYEPSNCKWSTKKEQAGNRQSNHWIEFDSRRMIVSDWEAELGVARDSIYYHLRKGRTDQEAILFYINKKMTKCR